MSSTSTVLRHRSVYLLLGILCLSTLLVPSIALTYTYDSRSLIFAALGFTILLVALGATWIITRSTRHNTTPTALDTPTRLGLGFGLLWVIEISINTGLAPPLPARDIIDNGFWALIAVGMLAASTKATYQSRRFGRGITVGIWSGFVSGVVACGMGLAVVVFGMPLLLRDPLNIAEWAKRASDVSAPTMAAYFAYETFAGAFLHLAVLGIGMGFVLGVIGGLLGTIVRYGP